ncbi:hypothetical protein ACEQ8H_003915 [Pleosporales sp. CAS-2024a]
MVATTPRRAESPPSMRHRCRHRARKQTWPPSPSVEDEAAALSKEGEPPVSSRGAVDQETLLEAIEDPHDRRYVLVSDARISTGTGTDTSTSIAFSNLRRRRLAERTKTAPLGLHVADPPVYTGRVSTPYAYTKPQGGLADSLRAEASSPEIHARRRQSFAKTDLQRTDLKTSLHDNETRPSPSRRESSRQQPQCTLRKEASSASPQDNSYAQSPPPSPRIPARKHQSPTTSRPASRGNTRPPSPLSSTGTTGTLHPLSPAREPVTDADWHSTYPPPLEHHSRTPSRTTRWDTVPDLAPRIDVHRPSPARPPIPGSALPYPVDDDQRLAVFMPAEEHYQFHHSTLSSQRQFMADSPSMTSSPVLASPRLRDDVVFRPKPTTPAPEDSTHRTRHTRSNSVRSHADTDGRCERSKRNSSYMEMDKPLPPCPRSTSASKYDDWYSLRGQYSFVICPSCYNGVFAGTPFEHDFAQTRRGGRAIERICDFSSPWMRLAWLLTIQQRRSSLELLHVIADIADIDSPCPEHVELRGDRITWYGIPDQRDGIHVANFTICPADKRMIEALLPTMRGYFTRIPPSLLTSSPLPKYMCSLRTSSRRFPKYLDLLVQLDSEARHLGQRPNISRFIQLARHNAFKGECAKEKAFFRKPWFFIPSLPELTVCEECYDDVIWPACQSTHPAAATIPRLFNKTLQLVPAEDPEMGSSCCLYSPRMRRVFDTSVQDSDFAYLKRKAVERREMETQFARERKAILNSMLESERGSLVWNRAKKDLKTLDQKWAAYE